MAVFWPLLSSSREEPSPCGSVLVLAWVEVTLRVMPFSDLPKVSELSKPKVLSFRLMDTKRALDPMIPSASPGFPLQCPQNSTST